MSGHYFALTASFINFCAFLTYAYHGDYARAAYWGGAVILTGSTVFMR
jgi:hypothetical protein